MIRLAISNQQAVHLATALMEWLDDETVNPPIPENADDMAEMLSLNHSILTIKQDLELELSEHKLG